MKNAQPSSLCHQLIMEWIKREPDEYSVSEVSKPGLKLYYDDDTKEHPR